MVSILLQVAAVAIGGVSLFVLLDMAKSLQVLRDSYVSRYQALRTVCRTGGWDGLPAACGDAVWVYRNRNWELSDETNCQAGCEPGLPPRFPGEYEGHTVRKQCRRQKKKARGLA